MTDSFNETVVIIGDAPTTYGELRERSKRTERLKVEDLGLAVDLRNVASWIRGMAVVIGFLLDQLEEAVSKEGADK